MLGAVIQGMKTKTHPRLRAAAAIPLFAGAAFIAIALATDAVGPVGLGVRDVLTWLLGGIAWLAPVELVLAGVLLRRGRSRLVLSGLLLADLFVAFALAMVFQTGVAGSTLGGVVREAISTLGTLLVVAAALGVVAVTRTSLLFEALLKGGLWLHGFSKAHIARVHAELAQEPTQPAKASLRPNVKRGQPVPSPAAPIAEPAGLDVTPACAQTALPSLWFLSHDVVSSPESQATDGDELVAALASYGIDAQVERSHVGPTVTLYELGLAAGTKLSAIQHRVEDLSMALGRKVRIVPAGPGLVGIELPNNRRAPVTLRSLLLDPAFHATQDALPVVLGRDMQGNAVVADLAAMPHVIVAGASGSGKSVGLNVMLASLLCRRTPAELRLMMIDPKVVELAPYEGIPHMLGPVVTDMKQAAQSLKNAIAEMERRYQLFARAAAKNIQSYNAKVSVAERLPYIVIVIDEFADLIMQQRKEVEAAVVRLGQKARAAGIHVIVATQRPSVDVVTGTIKANFSSRIAYRVAQSVDSRTILDEPGAENLLGACSAR